MRMNSNERLITYTLFILIISMFIVVASLYVFIIRVEQLKTRISNLEQTVWGELYEFKQSNRKW